MYENYLAQLNKVWRIFKLKLSVLLGTRTTYPSLATYGSN